MKLSNVSFDQRLAAIGGVVLLLSMTVFDWYGVVGDVFVTAARPRIDAAGTR